MDNSPLETDYLVIGTGATAMAFVDTLLDEQPDATVLMVDRLHHPGGHWNHAYPWVRVHQPSAWYGVASRELASGEKDKFGLNAGLYSMASGAEVLAHFDQVMQQRFLPSGRVRWLPMTDYQAGPDGTHWLASMVGGDVQTVQVRRKVVDGTHARTEVPATHAPRYMVAPGVDGIPINDLATLCGPHAHYTVVGSGKTGIDACLWLLAHGAAPARIRWIMPRDAWFLDRANFQPGLENFERNMGYSLDQFGAIIESATPADLFARLEAKGALLRLDPKVEPTTYRCGTVSRDELDVLRTYRRRGPPGPASGHRADAHRARPGGLAGKPRHAVHRLQRQRDPTAAGAASVRWRAHQPVHGALLPAAVQRRADRLRREPRGG
jgi:hypothetical protein